MADIQDMHQQLAMKMDQMPHGFPVAADRVELAILHWAFTAEEAQLAVNLPPEPATAEALAQLFDKPLAEQRALLDRMTKQGQLAAFKQGGETKYALMPWLPGMQEGQLYRRDKTHEQRVEFVRLWERYFPTYAKTASYGPPLARVVPVSLGVTPEARPHRLEDVHRMVDGAKSFWVMPCVCRQERGLLGHVCNHISEVCLVANAEEDNFEKWPEIGRVITKEEAHQILDQSEEDGLVHQTWNADSPSMFFICNCCSCCCVLLRPMTEFGQAHAATSDFVAAIDMDRCIACGDCLNDRCIVGAISESDGEYSVDQLRCIGCGVCALKCPVDTIKLNRKAEPDTAPTIIDWVTQKLTNRPSTL